MLHGDAETQSPQSIGVQVIADFKQCRVISIKISKSLEIPTKRWLSRKYIFQNAINSHKKLDLLYHPKRKKNINSIARNIFKKSRTKIKIISHFHRIDSATTRKQPLSKSNVTRQTQTQLISHRSIQTNQLRRPCNWWNPSGPVPRESPGARSRSPAAPNYRVSHINHAPVTLKLAPPPTLPPAHPLANKKPGIQRR